MPPNWQFTHEFQVPINSKPVAHRITSAAHSCAILLHHPYKYLTSGAVKVPYNAYSSDFVRHWLEITGSEVTEYEVTKANEVTEGVNLSPQKKPSRTAELFLWRWAGSNRRPNIAPKGFLHAYSFSGCRGKAAKGQTTLPLSSES